MAGRTDAWIVAQMAANHGLPCDADDVFERFHDAYIGHLMEEIHKPGPQKGVLPGVRAVLDALAAHSEAHLALLTGNFERGAQIKLEYFDLWRYFGAGAFGDRTHDRNTLLATALARVAAAGGPSVTAAEVVIVGDTPLDVAVAVAGGARSLAVATGSYDVEALRASGADVVLEDLRMSKRCWRGWVWPPARADIPGRAAIVSFRSDERRRRAVPCRNPRA